jgi:hypothetical protein
MKKKYITASEFEEKFEAGEDITAYLDLNNLESPGLKQKRMSLTLPTWMITKLDNEAKRIGTTRQSVIKFWISERLKRTQNFDKH